MSVLTAGERRKVRAQISARNTESTGGVRKPAWQTVINDMDDLIDTELTGARIRSVEAKATFSEVLMLDCLIEVLRTRRRKAIQVRGGG